MPHNATSAVFFDIVKKAVDLNVADAENADDNVNDDGDDEGCRLGICRDHRDRRSCKIFVSCVNFSRKQRSFLHILQVYTHLNVNFLHNC